MANKDYKQMLRKLRRAGAGIAGGNDRHYKITHPNRPGVTVTIPSSPSDWRAILNSKAAIKRMLGIEL